MRPASAGIVTSAVTGAVTGLASTYPWQLGPAASLPLWAAVGLGLGALLGRRRAAPAGAGYGIGLSLAFLYSRFGGSADDLPAYTLFVLAMCVPGALGGLVSTCAGSRLRCASGKFTSMR